MAVETQAEKGLELRMPRLRRFGNYFRERYERIVELLTLAMRVSIGWIFLYSGANLLYAELATGQMATAGYLNFAVRGPFAGFFQGMAGNPIVNALVVWGLILIGIALIMGLLVRWSSFWGIAMMFMFYLSAFPPEHNPFMDEHIVYMLVLAMFMVVGAGRVWGLDRYIEKTKLVSRRPWLKALLG